MIETRQQQRKSKAVASRLSIQQLSRFETGYCPTRKEVGRLEIAHHGSTTQQNPRRNCVVLGIVECGFCVVQRLIGTQAQLHHSSRYSSRGPAAQQTRRATAKSRESISCCGPLTWALSALYLSSIARGLKNCIAVHSYS